MAEEQSSNTVPGGRQPAGDMPPVGQVVTPRPVQPTSATPQPVRPVAINNAPPMPVTTPEPTQQATQATPMTPTPPSRKRPGLATILVAAVFILAASSAGAFFGLILPNQPENIWKQALSNTAIGYDKLVDYSESQKDVKGTRMSGEATIEGPVEGSASFESTIYEKDGNLKLTVEYDNQEYKLESLFSTPEGATLPDVYLNLSGFTNLISLLGLGGTTTGSQLEAFLNSLDGQWILFDHEFLESLGIEEQTDEDSELATEDFIEAARAISDVNKEYLFNTDTDKRVLTIIEPLGKEDRDGRSTYHFKIAMERDNTADYIEALGQRINETKLGKLVNEGNAFQSTADDLRQEENELSDSFDVWVDMQTKMIRYIKFTDADSSDFVEIGIPYNGGNEYPFTIIGDTEDNNGHSIFSVNFKLDTDTNRSTADFLFDYQTSEPTKLTANLTSEPHNEPIEITPPPDALTIEQLQAKILQLGVLGANTDDDTPQPPLFDLSPF